MIGLHGKQVAEVRRTLERIHATDEWWKEDAWRWQREVRRTLEEWIDMKDDRKIMVIYDPSGNHGKTTFCKKMQDTSPDHINYIRNSNMSLLNYEELKFNMSSLLKYKELKLCLVDYETGDASVMFLEYLKERTKTWDSRMFR